jgi:hypothetical protein
VEDQGLIDWLQANGNTVLVKKQRAVRAEHANNVDLVVLSGSISTRLIDDMFRHVAVPILTWELRQFEPLGMTQPGRRNFGYRHDQTDVNLVGNSGHPLMAGLQGVVTVMTAPTEFYWGTPHESADIIGIADQPQRVLIYGYERGDQLSGFQAPARRVALFSADGTKMTNAGWQLYQAAFEWSVSCR